MTLLSEQLMPMLRLQAPCYPLLLTPGRVALISAMPSYCVVGQLCCIFFSHPTVSSCCSLHLSPPWWPRSPSFVGPFHVHDRHAVPVHGASFTPFFFVPTVAAAIPQRPAAIIISVLLHLHVADRVSVACVAHALGGRHRRSPPVRGDHVMSVVIPTPRNTDGAPLLLELRPKLAVRATHPFCHECHTPLPPRPLPRLLATSRPTRVLPGNLPFIAD